MTAIMIHKYVHKYIKKSRIQKQITLVDVDLVQLLSVIAHPNPHHKFHSAIEILYRGDQFTIT